MNGIKSINLCVENIGIPNHKCYCQQQYGNNNQTLRCFHVIITGRSENKYTKTDVYGIVTNHHSNNITARTKSINHQQTFTFNFSLKITSPSLSINCTKKTCTKWYICKPRLTHIISHSNSRHQICKQY